MQCVDIVSRNSRSATPLAGYARSSTSNETDPQRDRKREPPAQRPLRESLLVAIPSASESLQLPTSSPQPEASVPTLAKPGVLLRAFAPPPAHSLTNPPREFRRGNARAATKNQRIRTREAADPIGTVHATRAFAGREQARHTARAMLVNRDAAIRRVRIRRNARRSAR